MANKSKKNKQKNKPPKGKNPKHPNNPKEPPKQTKFTLHLMQASLQFSDPASQLNDDLTYIFAQGADVIGFTESADDFFKQRISAHARDSGYQAVTFPKGDSQLAVKLNGDANTKVKLTGGIQVDPGVPGRYGPRFVRWVCIKWHGVDTWVHESHWVFVPHLLQAHGELVKRHTNTTRTMCAQVKKHGQGAANSFFMGDINLDEGADQNADNPNMPNAIFRAQGLLTIWDEFTVVPRATVGRSVFDIVGSFRPDQGVKGTRYQIHPKKHSDHSFVSAWYEVQTDVTGTGTPGGGGGGGGKAPAPSDPLPEDDPGVVDPDFYATGGNIDWSDYLDNELYPLPYAVDDSSSTRR